MAVTSPALQPLTDAPSSGSSRPTTAQGRVGLPVRQRDRIWYCIDDDKKTVWLTAVHTGHPKATE